MRNFRAWDIYTDGMEFVKDIYLLTKELPKEEIYGLSSQIRRAVISIVNNMAEGAAKSSSKDFNRFLEMSLGSAFEVETLLKIIQDLDYGDTETIRQLIEKVKSLERRINAFIQKIKKEDINV
ncbi:four helix bundle protein [Pseudotamlana carrageenivorans]|uniref:Diversity-generating retroelement protein bAvd family protein n=1 Tax=Pseudotamlana carrageenivorans TaxID=2069432 RepID=A0A2I7SIW5_9FLAO|nr:four helix bundle protein [Tamlana carrageenivorans]AUS05853.1 diversity-generating retroelement protein bAvd family protein [Tamlana carrageenivorans]